MPTTSYPSSSIVAFKTSLLSVASTKAYFPSKLTSTSETPANSSRAFFT